ncbi:MAG: hypothetical protein Q4A42_05030 [Tissierellia bacterium]|nr:hypothetical protein [Tissierellia bacterium]
MQEIITKITEKFSQYEIFNNFFPGIVFCYFVGATTKFSFIMKEVWENILLYYFVGVIVNRIGSVVVENLLKSIKVKNKKLNIKEPFLKFASYDDYIEASENNTFIKTLNQYNNFYRNIITIFILVILIKIYDLWIYNIINKWGMLGRNILFILICSVITIILIFGYRKQSDYIKRMVEKYINSK